MSIKANALLITRNFPPLTGGMERLTFHTYESLWEEYRCAVVGPRGCSAYVRPGTHVAECQLSPLARFLGEAWIKSYLLARRHRPRLILAASGLTAPVAVFVAKQLGCTAVTVVHGLDLVVRHSIYQNLFVPAIKKSHLVLANSTNTAKLAQAAGVASDKIQIVHPGVTLPPELLVEADLRRAHDLTDRHILLSVGRLVPRKGLAEFVDRALPELVARDPTIVLLIAGGEAEDALKRESGVQACIKSAVERHGLRDHVRLLGPIKDDAKLDALYRAADVFIMPLVEQAGDVEGFGMVAVEAAAHGVPTVAFSLGGLSDAVADGRSGLLVSPYDYPALIDATLKLLHRSALTAITKETCRAHASQFSWDCYCSRLMDVFGTIPSLSEM